MHPIPGLNSGSSDRADWGDDDCSGEEVGEETSEKASEGIACGWLPGCDKGIQSMPRKSSIVMGCSRRASSSKGCEAVSV